MFRILLTRFQQKHRTIQYPDGPPPELPDRYRGHPIIDRTKCTDTCQKCVTACPTDAIKLMDPATVDLGRCLFCTDCADACPSEAISFAKDFRLAAKNRTDLIIRAEQYELALAGTLNKKLKSMFGRSLKLRQVSAGGCNACEADTNVLGTVGWDLGRFGIQFVASPRHADGLLVTGPVTQNMALALQKAYDAVAKPKIVIAVGACAISGGPYMDHEQTRNGVGGIIPVDLYIPGCPPHPLTILEGLLRLIGRIEDGSRQ